MISIDHPLAYGKCVECGGETKSVSPVYDNKQREVRYVCKGCECKLDCTPPGNLIPDGSVDIDL